MADRILVTGADGFIGSHLVEALVRRGSEVRAFCCYNSHNSWGWLDVVPSEIRGAIDVVLGDVRDQNCVLDAAQGCRGIMHLAALIGIPYSYVAPEAYVDVNLKGTLNVLQAARRLDLEKVMHTSTSETYGSAQFVPITEEHPLVGQSPYAASKIGADQMAIAYHRSFGTPVAIARPFNTYGPRQSLRAVIPTVLAQLLDGAETLRLGDLRPRRDFNFVDDTVQGMLAVFEAPNSVGEVFNLGGGFDVSIGDMAELAMEAVGRRALIEVEADRVRPAASEVERLLCDAGKAKRLLGWTPQRSGLDGLRSGLQIFADWLRNPANRKRYVNVDRYVV